MSVAANSRLRDASEPEGPVESEGQWVEPSAEPQLLSV